ncbi:hypothetical protein IWQ54_002259 [Labrenzia sp. EL_195]|nr:hypothetical protein [Labrenzia sp. EL_195]
MSVSTASRTAVCRVTNAPFRKLLRTVSQPCFERKLQGVHRAHQMHKGRAEGIIKSGRFLKTRIRLFSREEVRNKPNGNGRLGERLLPSMERMCAHARTRLDLPAPRFGKKASTNIGGHSNTSPTCFPPPLVSCPSPVRSMFSTRKMQQRVLLDTERKRKADLPCSVYKYLTYWIF